MKKPKLRKSSLAAIGILFLILLLLGSCNKKEAPSAPTHLKAVVDGDCIHLSWRRVPNADYYRITVGFQTRDDHNSLADIYEVFLCETSDHTYNDRYPFDGMNYYKIEAVNEYGSSPCSEVTCDYLNTVGGLHVNLYPNPATNHVKIEFNSSNSMNYHITLESLLGEVIFDTEVAGVIGVSTYALDTDQFNAGIYKARVHKWDGETVKRFVIL